MQQTVMAVESLSDHTKYQRDDLRCLKRRKVCFGNGSKTVVKGSEPEQNIGLRVPHYDMA